MITYDYHCDANGETLTVSHSIKETLTTWGDLCSLANHRYGETLLHLLQSVGLFHARNRNPMSPSYLCSQSPNPRVVVAVAAK